MSEILQCPCWRCHSQLGFPFEQSWMSCCGAQPRWSCDLLTPLAALLCSPGVSMPSQPRNPQLRWDRGHPHAFVSSEGPQWKDFHQVKFLLSHEPFLGLCCILLGSPAGISMECDSKDGALWNGGGRAAEVARCLLLMFSLKKLSFVCGCFPWGFVPGAHGLEFPQFF